MRRSFKWWIVVSLAFVTPLQASLLLTPAGVSDGFSLTTFVSGYYGAYGPLAQGIASNGTVITGSLLNDRIYVFKDADNQSLASAVSAVPYAGQTGVPDFAMTTAGGQVYGVQLYGGVFEHFATNGSYSPIPHLQASGLVGFLGVWGNSVNGHLISSSNKGLVDIDPIAGTYRVINSGVFPDGVSVSKDGTVAYVEQNGAIQAYNIATGTHISTFFTGHSPDGTGVIFGGKFDGNVVVNNNDGTVGLLDPRKLDGDPSQFVIIARGGTRGDFVSPDTSNGTLFLSQNEQVARLSCGTDCSFVAPEPATFALLGGGLLVLAQLGRRRAKRKVSR